MSIFHSGTDPVKIREICERRAGRIHFVGAGGVGMCSLAVLMSERGFKVTGSDARESELTRNLLERGIDIRLGASPELSAAADLVVYTLAVPEDHPDVTAAERAGVPSVSRAELLGALMAKCPEGPGISGSHGKSTVTAMTDSILRAAGGSPTTVIGAVLCDTGLPLREGDGRTLVYEACEYKDSFLRFSPTAAVYTSLELDHTDYFRDLEALRASFLQSASACPLPILSTDGEALGELSRELKRPHVTYGERGGDVTADIRLREGGRYSLKIRHASGVTPEILLKVPAEYNARNALSAAALAISIGIDEDAVCRGLSDFSGLSRRMEYIGEAAGRPVYYDYAHHPTEVRAAIEGLREACRMPVTVIFKPHTFSRTRAFLSEFASALSLADRVIILDVDPVREKRDSRVSSETLAARIGGGASAVPSDAAARLALSGKPSAVILMGAGEVGEVLADLKEATRVM